MYSKQDLEDAFNAGSLLTYKDLAEYEGVYDGKELNYEDFEEWIEKYKPTNYK